MKTRACQNSLFYLRLVRVVDEVTEVVRPLLLHNVLHVVIDQVLPDVTSVLHRDSLPAQVLQLFLNF